MRELCIWLGLAVAATGGVVAACHSEVPGPQLPLPNREMPPQGDKPRPLLPPPKITPDGGLLPTQNVRQTRVQFAPSAQVDAAVDAFELPPNPDAEIVVDAASPLR